MQLTITEVVDSDPVRVGFRSEVGEASGVWSGDSPVPGSRYFVELSVDKVLMYGTSVVAVDEVCQPSIHGVGGRAVLVGHLERIDEDGMGIFRVGDSVMMLEIVGDSVTTPAWVRVGPVELLLSDMNY
jgi:hypothetical protein